MHDEKKGRKNDKEKVQNQNFVFVFLSFVWDNQTVGVILHHSSEGLLSRNTLSHFAVVMTELTDT